MTSSFQPAKVAMVAATYLIYSSLGAKICLMADASAYHARAALQQKFFSSATWHPLGFFSKKLEPAQVKYFTFDQELWACVASIRHFRFMLEGRQFTILTDHKLLTYALSRSFSP
jgi:hypothetical protein